MLNLILFLTFFSIFFVANATDNTTNSKPEVIEVLAPKATLSLLTYEQQNYLYHQNSTSLNRTITDSLTLIPGVSLSGQGGQFQSYAIRGFSRGHVLTEIDGIPVITDRRAGNSISFIAPELIDSGQVFKGPSSTIYGSQALGGVVSLTTDINLTHKQEISVQGSVNTVGFVYKKQDDFTSHGVAYQQGNNERAANGDELNTQYERISGVYRNDFNLLGLDSTFSWLASYGQDIGKSNTKYKITEVSDYPEERHSMAQLKVNSSSNWLLKLFHHYQNWDSATERSEQYHSLTKYQSHTLGSQWLKSISSTDFESYVGIDWLARKGVNISSEYLFLDAASVLNDTLVDNALSGQEDNVALFNKTSFRWLNADISIGLRYDWIKQQHKHIEHFDNNVNGSFAALLLVMKDLRFDIELANGFRYPTLSERYFDGRTPRGLVKGNNELVSETSVGTQLNAYWQYSNNLHLYASVYHYDLDNFIERYQINDDLYSYRNIASAKQFGFETLLNWTPNDYSEHKIQYQHQHGEDSNQQTLSGLMQRSLKWNWIVSFKKWSVSNVINHIYSSTDVGQSDTERDQVTLWNIAVDYQLSHFHQISLSMTNVTNTNYYGNLDENAPLQPERNVKIATKWQF